MRALIPVVVPWLVMIAALAGAYLVEARAMRDRRTIDGVPVKGPSVGLSLLGTLLLGPLVAPIYFWLSRKKPSGLLLGLGVTAASVALFLGTALLARALVLSRTVAEAHAACLTRGPLASDPDAAKSEGPCAALVEAYETGRGCADGVELVSCQSPIGLPFSVEKSPEKARAVLEHRCVARQELGACLGLGQRATSDAERESAKAHIRKVCCTWWETGVCERFTNVADCRR